jgi:hypothetical protein
MAPAEIARRLDERVRLLAGGSRRSQERHRTLLAAVSWSHDLLTDDEKVVLSTRFGSVVDVAWSVFMPVVCERGTVIGTGFFRSARRFRRRVGSGLVGFLVINDDAEHIWWFRPSGTTEVVWWVASGSRNAGLVAG